MRSLSKLCLLTVGIVLLLRALISLETAFNHWRLSVAEGRIGWQDLLAVMQVEWAVQLIAAGALVVLVTRDRGDQDDLMGLHGRQYATVWSALVLTTLMLVTLAGSWLDPEAVISLMGGQAIGALLALVLVGLLAATRQWPAVLIGLLAFQTGLAVLAEWGWALARSGV